MSFGTGPETKDVARECFLWLRDFGTLFILLMVATAALMLGDAFGIIPLTKWLESGTHLHDN
jgi:hypothetical protein